MEIYSVCGDEGYSDWETAEGIVLCVECLTERNEGSRKPREWAIDRD